ncbi:hypothetical protein SJAV_14020 [Sulfurisphaera javensis]|uniref:Uncharacterized protein n=1 Tax=Sulfurisphaera javensis TaxID=2049879 RepID=A0AAT9GRG5_9CREN
MKSYELVSYLIIFDSILVYLYLKNIEYLALGIIIGLSILFGIKFIFEKFVA